MAETISKSKADHRVVLVKCEDYHAVPDALAEGVGLLGGIEQFCSPDEKILLKPNLLLGEKPEEGVTTHPSFFEAAASLFQSAGAKVVYGDSPAVGSPQLAVRMSGLGQAAELVGVELADFIEEVNVHNPDGILLKQFKLAKGILEADGVINLPKFKTHGLTRLTGAVKNLFGCLPGVQKTGFHARLPDENQFGEMLVDLAELVSPRLHIMDAIIGMEGNGPRNGQTRQVGLILVSTNPHALDHCAALLMNLEPALVPTLKAARKNGRYQPEAIQVLGESIQSCVMADYDVNRSPISTTGTQGFHMKLLKNLITPKPVIKSDKCTRCGRCVRVCPATPKAIGFVDGRRQPPQYDYQGCIRCYCCQEVCPDEAIWIKTPPAGQLLNKIHL